MELSDYSVAVKPKSLMGGVQLGYDEIADGSKSQLPIPFMHVDRLSGHGLRRGCVTVVAGPPGNGKTMLALHFAHAAQAENLNWIYWPMEDAAQDYFERYVAIHANNWELTGGTIESAKARVQYTLSGGEISQHLSHVAECFLENPYLPIVDEVGQIHKPKPNATEILDHILRIADETDLLLIDPLSGIRFKERGAGAFWEQQEEFMSDLSNCIKGKRIHVMLVAHTSKQKQWGKEKQRLTMDSIQGAAAFQRFAQYVFLLDFHHDPIESTVVNPGANLQMNREIEVMHKRTLYLGKTRYAKGAGLSVAMDFNKCGPRMKVHGVIRRK